MDAYVKHYSVSAVISVLLTENQPFSARLQSWCTCISLSNVETVDTVTATLLAIVL